MLRRLRNLFEPETAAPQAGGGKLTLRDILLRGWEELWYQPKIELRTKRLVGAEGLVRARLPDGSIVPPGDFLPGAKEEEMLAPTSASLSRRCATSRTARSRVLRSNSRSTCRSPRWSN